MKWMWVRLRGAIQHPITRVGLGLLLFLTGCGRDEPEASAPAPAVTVATFTPTVQPGVQVAAADDPPVAATATISTTEIILLPTATPTLPLPTPTPTPTATPLAVERIERGLKLHRYGDYAAARAEFVAVLNLPNGDPQRRLQARYELARTYLADGSYGEALATLDQLDQELAASRADPDEFARKEQFLRGEALQAQGRYAEAIAAYWRFLESHPWMAEIVQPHIATAYLAAGNSTGAADAYRRAADAASDTVYRVSLLERLAQTHNGAGRYNDAVAVYDEILAVAQNAGYRAEILYLAGQSLASAGDTPGAIARWQAATTEAPASGSAYLALVELVNRNVDFDLYQRGYIDLQAEQYLPAINAYQAYVERVDTTDSRYGLALHGLGQSYLGAQNYAQALPFFERVLAEHPTCPCFGQAWLDKGATQAALGDAVGARRTYRTFAREHPGDPLADDALWRSGLQALYEGNQLEATTDFLTLADAFPNSDRTPSALYAISLGAFQNGLYSQAVELYTRLQKSYPEYKWDAVGYWLGRAHAARGEGAAAQAQWQALVEHAPDLYYGVLAAYSLNQLSFRNGSLLLNMPTIAGPPTHLEGDDGGQAFAEAWLAEWIEAAEGNLAMLPVAVAEDQDLRRGRLLLELDQRGDALSVLNRLFERHKDDPRALYPLSLEFERLGAYRFSIAAMQRLLEFSPAKLVEDAPIFLQQRSYPRPFGELIEQEARNNNLNPLLYYSLIRQESLFEEGARSSAVAQGLAQIIPDTGQWIAQQLGHPDYTNEIIYRPHINLMFGAYYLERVRRDWAEGNLISALAGYNGGPGNISRWRAASGVDDTLFVELIDYSESRLYIQLVTGNLYHYTRLYG